MRVLIAPDSFKGTATAAEVADAIASGWLDVRPGDEVACLPMADGGEGTLDAFATAYPDARRMPVEVRGPDDRRVRTSWLALPDGRAVVELAATSGLPLMTELAPDTAHTVGFGEAIAAALDAGATGLVLGIGGSASTDGGLGMLLALGLGVRPAGLIADSPGSAGLDRVRSVDRSGLRPLPPGGTSVLTDVESPLVGPGGAAAVFGPQKGVAPSRVPVFDDRLARWAARFPDVDAAAPGSGAAGGTGFGLLVWGASIVPGSAVVAEALGLARAIDEADLVITGEGRYDAQSAAGKVPAAVIAAAAGAGVPVALVAGSIDDETGGFAHAVALRDLAAAAGDAADAVRAPAVWARAAGAELARRCRS